MISKNVAVLIVLFVFSISVTNAFDATNTALETDEINNFYGKSLVFPLEELTKQRTISQKNIWNISNVLNLMTLLDMSLSEAQHAALVTYTDALTKNDNDSANAYNVLMDLMNKSLASYLALNSLHNLKVENQFLLQTQLSNQTIEYELDIPNLTSVSLHNKPCHRISNAKYICDLPVLNTDIVSVSPLSLLIKLELPFYKRVLSKILGGNETLFDFELPVYFIPSNLGELSILGQTQVLQKTNKTFDFNVSHRNSYCKSFQSRTFTYSIPAEFSVVGKPIFQGSIDGKIKSLSNIGNKIVFSALVKNSGQCLDVFSSRLSKDRRGEIKGRIVVNAEAELSTMQSVPLFNKQVTWQQEVVVDLSDASLSSGSFITNQSDPVDLFESPFLSVVQEDKHLNIKVIEFQTFLQLNSLN